MIDLSIPMPLGHVLLDLQWSCFEVKLARLLPQVSPEVSRRAIASFVVRRLSPMTI